MDKEELQCLVGKYLNGYKIVKVENDPFIKGQINLFTDEWEYGAFNDRYFVKFFVRNESNATKIYKELVDKENTNLKQALIEIRELVNGLLEEEKHWAGGDHEIYEPNGEELLQIIDKALGGKEE